ncbi:CNNM domain-containing protein, partial [Fusobacterium ulcerans]|uniref:CNNM domain-containing protein n=1 Tax=Fusobacterium ulcerans TaxID=861 RepID=UPI0026F01879
MDETPGTTNVISQLLFLLILTIANAFFAGAEMATVSVNKNKIKILAEEGNKNAQLLQELLKEPTRFLSTIQVAITLSGFLASASAATSFSYPLNAIMTKLGIPYGETIAIIIVTIILSFFTLVFGELVPKRIALQKAEIVSLFTVKPVLFISKLTSPFIKLLSFSTNFVLQILGMKAENLEENISKEEIRSMVEVGQANGVFNETEKEMINSIFEFDDILASEIMIPRTDVYSIDIDASITEYLDELLSTKHSRIPVYEEDIDNIIGVLYIKDLILEARNKGFENVDIRSILRKPYLVPESKNIDTLFKEMQKSKKYIAILIDEYGGFSGIVTMEDLVEEVMGNIDDEYDDNEPKLEKIDNHIYLVDGIYSIDDLIDNLDIDIISKNHNTISGYLIDILGEIPDDTYLDKEIEVNDIIFKIKSIKENRIDKIEEKIDESYKNENTLIDIEGKQVGVINGLSVLSTGEHTFGKPSRITVATACGNRGIVNIEREVKMSGSIHNKGVLILEGYLAENFAQEFPLSLNAYICFEQNYGGVDGDSASSAELYALLSSLSNLAIKQNIAVTGSINQKGQIQVVG